ncbi:MAG: HipA domain-containing protein [Nocardioides sp.]|uniref:HipA domain-containing protein n=1 Tax=Nocardioides sp. TaxID=35761 RepID=UPI0039E2A9E7
MTTHPIVDVSDWVVRFPEPGGSDANVWLLVPESDESALFKPVVAKEGRRQGEDWAEKAVEQIANEIGVPAARIEMATRNGHPGLLSFDLAGRGVEMQTGAVLIGEIDQRLVPRAKERLGHNLTNIRTVLHPLAAPAMGGGAFTAFDQFCGYLILDALVANRDRHEENWAVLRSSDGVVTLAPSYDHGNSLGFNLLDMRRLRQLESDPGACCLGESGDGRSLRGRSCRDLGRLRPPSTRRGKSGHRCVLAR